MIIVSVEIKEESSNFEPVNFVSDNEVKDGTDNTLPTLRYKYAIDTIHQVNEIIDHSIVTKNTFLLPHGEDGEVIRDQVKSWAAQFYQDQEMFLFSLGEGQDTNIMTYDAITKGMDMQLQRKYELEDKGKFLLLQDITYHCLIKGSNSRYEVMINWEDGYVTWEPL